MYLYSFFNCISVWGVDGQHNAMAALPQGINPYPLCRRLVGSKGQCGRARKISVSPAFDPQTIQAIVSCCTDYAITASISTSVPK